MSQRLRLFARRERRLITFVVLTLGLGLAAALAGFQLVRVERVWPLSFAPSIRPHAIPDTSLTMPWSANAVMPAAAQTESVRALLDVLLALAFAAVTAAIVNAAGMVSARGTQRRREQAIRMAVGASPAQLRRERLAEAVVLCGGGVLAGVGGALLLRVLLRVTWPAGLEWNAEANGVSAAVPLLFNTPGLLLAAMLRGRAREDALRGELAAGASTMDRVARRAGRVPVIASIALALTIACTTTLLYAHGRAETRTADDAAAGLVTMEVSSRSAPARDRAQAWSALLDRVGELRGVTAESLATPGAWLGMGVRDEVLVECGECYRAMMYMPLQPAFVVHHAVSPGFFEAMRVPLRQGRYFQRSDNFDSMRVAIVNETFARRSFERGRPIGRRVQVGGRNGRWYTIVGVVADVPARGIGAPRTQAPAIYLSTQQEPPSVAGLAARTDLPPADLATRVELAAQDVAIGSVRDAVRMEEQVERAVAPLRWFALLLAVMAAAATILAAHGVIALVRFNVRSRRKELAIRAATGATPARLFAFVLRDMARTAAIGLGIGGVAAWTVGRALQLQIGGLPPIELQPAMTLALLLTLAALVAVTPAALEAARAAPARVLRTD